MKFIVKVIVVLLLIPTLPFIFFSRLIKMWLWVRKSEKEWEKEHINKVLEDYRERLSYKKTFGTMRYIEEIARETERYVEGRK